MIEQTIPSLNGYISTTEEQLGGSIAIREFRKQEKVVEPKTYNQTITSDLGYDGLSKVEVLKVTKDIDSNIIDTNIKDGVTILGVTGKLKEGYQLEIIGNTLKFTKGANVEGSKIIL